MATIEHLKPCEQRLLGYVAENLPQHATFNLRNLRSYAEIIRRERKAPDCDCGRIQLATALTAAGVARKRGIPAGELAALREEIRDLRDLVQEEERRRLEARHQAEREALEREALEREEDARG